MKLFSQFKTLLAIFAVLFLGGVVLFGVISIRNLWNPGYSVKEKGKAVVLELRSLNRLETASASVEKIIEAGTDGNDFQELLFGDRILLVASGEVVAGIDLSKMDENSISQNNDGKIEVKLPPAEIFSVSLDNSATRVFDRDLGFLTRGDKNLESEARLRAESLIKEAACVSGILENARDNAEKQIEAILKTAGLRNFTIIIPSSECK